MNVSRVGSYSAFFSFLYLKKQNFKNICRIRKFLKMGACRPNGRRGRVAHPVGVHLAHGAQGALNNELVKTI